MGEGWRYVAGHRLVAALIGIYILWATGGGALNLVYDRVGGVTFAGRGGLEGNAGVAALARQHQSVNLGQGFPDDPGPEDVRRQAAD